MMRYTGTISANRYDRFHEGDGGLASPREERGRPGDWGAYFLEAEQASVLICADQGQSGPSAGYLSKLVQALGHRVLDTATVAQTPTRLSELVDVDVIMLSCSGHEPGLDSLLARLDMMARTQHNSLVVITGLEGLDGVHAALQSENAVLLCEPGPEDIVVALAASARRRHDRQRLYDIGHETETNQIERLSDQLARLNRTIEALVSNREPASAPEFNGTVGPNGLRSPGRSYSSRSAHDISPGPAISGQQVRAVLRARRLREHIVAPDLFADPAWDILLDLMAARLERTRVSVSSLCIAAAVPPTTALRWIRQLTDRGLLQRQADPRDGRRIFIALSDEGADAVSRWFHGSRTCFMAALGLDGDARETAKLPT